MKKIILLLTILLPVFCSSQEQSRVVQAEGKTAPQLYSSAREWFAVYFKSANDVIQLEDPVNYKLIGKGIRKVYLTLNNIESFYYMNFMLSAEFKDGRFKQSIVANSYTTGNGTEYSSEQLQQFATEEGLKAYYNQIGVKEWIVGKKQITQIANEHKNLLIEIDNQLVLILGEMEKAIATNPASEDW